MTPCGLKKLLWKIDTDGLDTSRFVWPHWTRCNYGLHWSIPLTFGRLFAITRWIVGVEFC